MEFRQKIDRVSKRGELGVLAGGERECPSLYPRAAYNISQEVITFMVILTPTQDFVDSLIAIAQDFPEDALAIHQGVEQLHDLVQLTPTGVLRLPFGYEVLYSSRSTVSGDTEVLLGRIQRIIH
jgi:hypothetical protein